MTAFNMQRLVAVIISTMIIEVASRCNHPQPKKEGQCHFTVNCYGDIQDVIIKDKMCQNMLYNGLANIELILENPDDIQIDDLDINQQQFLESVTNFKVFGRIPNKLNILNLMKNLKGLDFTQNNIAHLDNTTFSDMYYLEKINLSHNQLSNVDELFSFGYTRNRLNILLLSYNKIKQLSGLTFGELSSLVELDLSNNLISDLQEEPFLNLVKLKILRLDQNRITHLNGALNKLESLTQLYLNNNEIENINETSSLKILADLAVFDVSGNKLTEVSPLMFSRHWDHITFTPDSGQVCKISLSDNVITNIINAFEDNNVDTRSHSYVPQHKTVCASTEVDLSNNDISFIEYNAFSSIVELTRLDLSNNQLEGFCVNNTNLQFVRQLNLSSNILIEVCDECFDFMNNVESLDMSNNKFDYFPQYLLENTDNLKYLKMANNTLKKIESLYLKMFHSDRGILDLSNNGLNELSILSGKDFVMLKIILQLNGISDLHLIDLRGLHRLNFLDLSKNTIESLTTSSLNLPDHTFSLDMSDNKINSIAPGSFKRLRYLRHLNLDHNDLSKLEYGIFQGLDSLIMLDLSFNQIQFLDSKKLIDLKSIEVLYLRNNNMFSVDYTIWLGHKLSVYVDGNSLSCDWLGTALNDYNNGFSKVKITVLKPSTHNSSLDGIACASDNVQNQRSTGSVDRLLVLVQKLLQAVDKQTLYLSNSYPMKLQPPMHSTSDKNTFKYK